MQQFECKTCNSSFKPAYRLSVSRTLYFCSKRCAAQDTRTTFVRASDLIKEVRRTIRENGRYTAQDEIIQALSISTKTLVKFNVSVVSCNRLEGFKRPKNRAFEDRVGQALEMKFEIEREVSFEWAKSPKGHALRFDFLLVGKRILVEADGGHHKAGHPWSSEYVLSCDRIKDEYSKSNGYTLVRIPYSKRITPDIVHDHIAAACKATTQPVTADVNA